MKKLTWLLLVLGVGLQAQEESRLTARELFYREDAPIVVAKKQPAKTGGTPTQAKVKPPVETGTTKTEVVATAVPGRRPESDTGAVGTTPSGVPLVQAALHLGVRYNVLKVVDREAKKREPVDPDTSFVAGDCVAVELMPNRNGFLYVFNRGTTGAWQALLPSPDMPDERNRVMNGKVATIPSEHCFEIDANAGTERLLVVITEKEEDARRLSDAMRQQQSAPQAVPVPAGGAQIMLAGGRIPHELEMMRTGQMIGRDIKLAKMGSSREEGEPPNAVYAVKTSASPSDRLVIEIALRHE